MEPMMKDVTPSTPSASGAFTVESEEYVYRPISNMAVGCFIAAVLSLASFFNMYLIPLAAVVLAVSIVTSVRLEKARDAYGGQLLAKLAIFLALVATIGAATRHAVTYFVVSRDARAFGEEFLLALLEDDLHSAFVMRVHPYYRFDHASGEVKPTKDILFQYNKEFEGFKKEWVTSMIRAGGSQSTITYLGSSSILAHEGLDFIWVRFQVDLATTPPRHYEVALGLHGGVSLQGDWPGRQWYVYMNDHVTDLDQAQRNKQQSK